MEAGQFSLSVNPMKNFATLFLTVISTAAILSAAVLPLFPWVLVIPLLYLFLNRILAGIPLKESAPKAYLMYFLMGLSGIPQEASELRNLTSPAQSSVEPGELTQRMTSHLVSQLPGILVRTLSPLLCGIAVYIIFGATDDSGSPLNTSHLQQLNDLLQRAKIPDAAATLMQELLTQTEHIRNRSSEFGHALEQAASQITAVGTQAAASSSQFSALSTQTALLANDLKRVRSSISELQQDVEDVKTSVSEIGQVIDDFSDIAASRILNFSVDTAQASRQTEQPAAVAPV